MPYVKAVDHCMSEYYKHATNAGHTTPTDWSETRAALDTLRRASARLHHLAERQCNGEGWGPREQIGYSWYPAWTDADDAKLERLEQAALTRAKDAASRLGVILVEGSGDPRGASLWIEFPDIGGNGWRVRMYF